MKRIRAIGVGAGGIHLLTVQAVEALRATDVFFIFDMGEDKAELANLRKAICACYCTRAALQVCGPAQSATGCIAVL
ncbi:protein of unknown function [Hyphomicrobium sp. 1Nfss2.1]|uniref:hypothetical protein n=1 Tax=Hyphomicrobium sp. 1Nfss2.1 TaxID=3413936 RepID=UPI003C7AD056